MLYRLGNDLSCCDVGGHIIFLDVARDRYFRLSDSLENAIRRFQANEQVSPVDLAQLAAMHILVETTDSTAEVNVSDLRHPSRSAIEHWSTSQYGSLSPAILLEVTMIVFSMRRRLSSLPLKTVLDQICAYRKEHVATKTVRSPAELEESLLQVNRQFARARRLVPVEPTCLLDSLALLRFLSRRGLATSIVFGVTPQPFAAHCWVQAGDFVLNETVSDAAAHTLIKVV